jgi:hypothetical protein
VTSFARIACLSVSLSVSLGCIQAVQAESLPDRVRDCAARTDSGARLSCYDQLAVSLGQDPDNGSAAPSAASASAAKSTAPAQSVASNDTAPDEPASPATPDTQFGIPGSKLERKKEAATLKQIEAVVTGVAKRPRGELVVTLDNGQVWAQLQAQEYFPLKAGDTVHIAKAALGSYFMTIPAKRGSKVTRLL